MTNINLKGSLPLLILHVLSEGQNHGYQIAKRIKEESEGVLDFKEGTLYPALHGLEKQNLIQATTQTVNGRERRYYRITDAGTAALEGQRREWEQYASAINQILGANQT